MDLPCDQANPLLDHTAQKEKSELAHRGKLGKRRRPSRVCLKANLIASSQVEDDETRSKIGKKLKNEENKCDEKNDEDCRRNGDVDETAIIKQGPKGTIIEICSGREREIPILNRSRSPENDDFYSGPVIKGAILKTPENVNIEKHSLNVMENGIGSSSDDEEDFLIEDVSSRRWKSLPSLDKATKSEEKEDAPWVGQVKLRHVDDPESPNRRGCSVLFFGPLPKPPPTTVDGSAGSGTPSANDWQLPQTQQKSGNTFRPVRTRPASLCERVQIQTWDRRHLTANSRTNGERKRDSKFRRSDPTRNSKIWQDIPQITHASMSHDSHPEVKEVVKGWKTTETLENGVHRSKSLNGIDKDDRQPEWIELSKKVTSKNIDWDNLPTAKKGSRGKSFQNELRVVWKKLGNQLNSEPSNEKKAEEKEEIVLKEDDLPVIRNCLTKQDSSKLSSKMFSHREKLDTNANSRCQKKAAPIDDHVHETSKNNSIWSSNSLGGNGDVSWIKEAEKRRQKYMDWQRPAVKEEDEKEEEEPEGTKNVLQVCENVDKAPVPSREENKGNDEETSPFAVKLRRVRCAKPEECFHRVKCPLPSLDRADEQRSSVSRRHSSLSSPRSKTGSDESESVVRNGVDNENGTSCKQSSGESFSVQLSDFEGDNFYVVINERDDDSFLQIKSANQSGSNNDNSTSRSFKREDTKLEEWTEKEKAVAIRKLIKEVESVRNDKLKKEGMANGDHFNSYNEDSTVMNCRKSIISANSTNSDVRTEVNKSEVYVDAKENGKEMDSNCRGNDRNDSLDEEQKNEDKESKGNGLVTKTRNGIQETFENLTINGISAIPIYPRKTKRSHKTETLEEKASRMTNDICGVLSSLGRHKTEVEKQSLRRDILKTLTCPSIRQNKEKPSRTLTLVTCDGDGLVASSVQGRLSELSSVGVQTNCDDIEQEVSEEKKNPKKVQTRIKKKTVKIIIHECEDDEEKQEVVEEIVEQILEPRQQKGKMVRKEPTICRAVEETEDGHKYLATTVTDGCTFCIDDSS
ncbi:uncharacterized protein LOC111630610 isoform X2 [Centruroides sculpturatus]|uniref:uncharacterized protein LOC111630610 isoform X2 n=1 Tax=Centruroides sculpturatus TaxID=218467 RepID=UPI000C6E7E27|nr:uncharacterized protein LOC111630610 isoform X2 [Centruroides sculpturatus]